MRQQGQARALRDLEDFLRNQGLKANLTREELRSLLFNLNYDNLSAQGNETHWMDYLISVLGSGDFSLKLSNYDGPGFPLDEHIFSTTSTPDQKRSILRSLFSQEEKSTGRKIKRLNKDESLSYLEKAFKTWEVEKRNIGGLSEYELERTHYYEKCGTYGERETDNAGHSRYTVYKCNERRSCPDCNQRYYEGLAVQLEKKVAAAAQATKTERVWKFRFTLPEHIRNQVINPQQMKLFVRAANRILQEAFGCPMKGRGQYVKGSVGVFIQIHWYSSGEPWKKKPHIHALVLPVRISKSKSGQVTVANADRFFSKSHLKTDLKTKWSKAVKDISATLGFEGVDEILEELVVDVSYIPILKNLKKKGSPCLNLKYDLRSPAKDLFKSVVCSLPTTNQIIMSFSYRDAQYFAVWKEEDLFQQLKEKLSIKQNHSSYGWVRRFEKYAPELGIEVYEEKDDFDPDPEKTVSVVYKRKFETMFDPEKGKLVRKKRLYVKAREDPDEPQCWKELDPYEVRGETVFFGSRKVYGYRVLNVQ